MLFILFWTLTVQFTWQSMGQSQASRFSSKISLWFWNDMGISEKIQDFHFGVEHPSKAFM